MITPRDTLSEATQQPEPGGPDLPDLTVRPAEPRTVLMVMYYFPPVGGVAMGRNLGHVLHLPRDRWLPVVLTPADPAAEPRDSESADLVPDDTTVLRTSSVEAGHIRRSAVQLRQAVRRLGGGRPGLKGSIADGSAISGGDPMGLTGIRRAVFFPDDQIGWLPFALMSALRCHRSAGFDAVFSSSSPITAHLIAGVVKQLTGVPWVAEFRDPWVGHPITQPLGRIRRWAQARIESWIVHSADRIVCVTPSLTRMYRDRYPAIDRFETITNGYSRSEHVVPVQSTGTSTRFRLVYAGTLSRPTEIQVFLEALDIVVTRRPEVVSRLEVAFFGTVNDACARIAAEILDRGRLSSVVRFEGFVSRSVALSAIANADAALVLLGAGPAMDLFVPGKMYEYLGQDRRILAMLPPGDAREILERLGWGVVADPEPSTMAAAIERLLDSPRPTRPADPDGLYDRTALARQLADVLTAAARQNRRGARPARV